MDDAARRRMMGAIGACVLAWGASQAAGCGTSSAGGSNLGEDAGADGGSGQGADSGNCGVLGCAMDLADASIGVRANALLGGCAGGPEASCHNVGAGGMRLPDVPPNLVDVASTEEPTVMRVAPGDPDHSYLYWKLTGDPRIDGGRMPLGLSPLTATEIRLVHDWIEAGAPRN